METKPGACRICNSCRTLFVAAGTLEDLKIQLHRVGMCINWCDHCRTDDGQQIKVNMQQQFRQLKEDIDAGNFGESVMLDESDSPAIERIFDSRTAQSVEMANRRADQKLREHIAQARRNIEINRQRGELRQAWERANTPSPPAEAPSPFPVRPVSPRYVDERDMDDRREYDSADEGTDYDSPVDDTDEGETVYDDEEFYHHASGETSGKRGWFW